MGGACGWRRGAGRALGVVPPPTAQGAERERGLLGGLWARRAGPELGAGGALARAHVVSALNLAGFGRGHQARCETSVYGRGFPLVTLAQAA